MAIYAYEGIGIVLPCETGMKGPERFPRLLTICMMISTVNYLVFGLLPYLAFGSATDDIITTNLSAFAALHGRTVQCAWLCSLFLCVLFFLLLLV
jgi:amino acid permease